MPTRLRRSRSRLLPRHDDGLSVAEMVVAISVTVVVLISAGAAFLKMGEAQRSAEAADRGTQMVQDKLETIHKLPYDEVGCYTNDPPVAGVSVCPDNVPPTNPTSPVNSSNNERIVKLGDTRPPLAPGATAPLAVEDNTIGDANGNKYKVTTVVTWADQTDPNRTGALPGAPAPAPAPGAYKSKRVTVTASWTLGGKTRTVTRQWLRSPTWMELFPPAAAGARLIGPSCVYKVPFCRINITEGQVLQAVTGFPASRAIEFTVQMSVETSRATIKHGTITKTLTDLAGGGITNNGRTLTYVIPINGSTGTGVGGVEPGANTVTIGVDTIYGHADATKDVNWRTPPSTGFPYQLASLQGVWDTSRTTTNLAPPTGGEAASNWFCVKLTDNTLWRYTAVIADETNVDEMDGYTAPKLYATGMDPADPNPKVDDTGVLTDDLSQHPSVDSVSPLYKAVAAPVGGYVGTQKIPNNSLNTIRWSYGFQPGTKFPTPATGGTNSNIIISGRRPGDGAAANASLTMPVYAVPYVTDCATADTYVPLKAALTGSATGSTNTLNWTAPFGADNYKLYRVGTALPIASGGSGFLTTTDVGRPWGSTTSYYVVAYKGTVAGNLSDTLTVTTGPGPSTLSGTATGQTNTLTWTAATAADSYKLYRVAPYALIPSSGLTATDPVLRSWGTTTSYYVVPYMGAIAGTASTTYTQTTGPGPSTLSGTAISSTNTLTWTAATGADSYKLYRTPNTLINTVSGLTLADPVARSPWGTTTSYYVVPYMGTIAGAASTTFTLTTGPGPSTLTGSASGTTNSLYWTAVTGADLYTLYRGAGIFVASTTGLSAATSSSWGATNSYYVTTSKSGVVGANSNTLTLTTLPGKPATPTTTTDYWNFTVWCPTTTGATSNTIRRYDTAGTITDVVGIALGAGWQDPNTITHADSTNYWCAAVNSAGTGIWSDPVLASGYYYVPAAPTGLYLSSAWGLAHNYAWSATPGATQYWLAHSAGTPAVTVAGTAGTLTLATDTTYSISVYAYSAYGRWSAPSAAVQTDTPLSRMYMGGQLRPAADNSSRRSNSMVSPDGQYVLLLQVDGNLVLYGPNGYTVKRSTGTYGQPNMAFVFQGDGHPVLYTFIDDPVWRTALRYTGVLGSYLQMNVGGNFVLYNAAWSPVWSSDGNLHTLFL